MWKKRDINIVDKDNYLVASISKKNIIIHDDYRVTDKGDLINIDGPLIDDGNGVKLWGKEE